MLRFFGGVLIFIVAAYFGFHLSDRLKSRRDFLQGMCDALSFISAEIEFGHFRLKEVFLRSDIAPGLKGFFSRCAIYIDDLGGRAAWEKTVSEYKDIVPLKLEDTQALSQLGKEIGMRDINSQKKAIQRTLAHMDTYSRAAEEEYLRLGKPYRSCGILLGVFFLIIII